MQSASTQSDARQLESTGVYVDIADLEQRLRRIESTIDGASDKHLAHIRAKQRDARDTLDRGETVDVVVITPPEDNNGTDAVSKIEGIYTFVEPGPYELDRGDIVRVRITDVGDNHAEALTLTRINPELNQ